MGEEIFTCVFKSGEKIKVTLKKTRGDRRTFKCCDPQKRPRTNDIIVKVLSEDETKDFTEDVLGAI